MDLVQRIVEFLTDASDGDLGFITLCLQASDGLPRALAILCQLVRGPFELCALGMFQLRAMGGSDRLDELELNGARARFAALYEGGGEGDLLALFEPGQPPTQRLEGKVALFQFELLLVEQLYQKQILLIDQVAALLCMLRARAIQHVLELSDLSLEDVLLFAGDAQQIA